MVQMIHGSKARGLALRHLAVAGASLAAMAAACPALAQTSGAAVTYIPIEPGYNCGGVTGDGTIVYDCHSTWRAGTVEDITDPDNLFYLLASNADGTVFAGGQPDTEGDDEGRGFIWTRAGGLQFLDVSALEPVSSINGISSNGQYFAVTSLARPEGARIETHDCERALVTCTSNVYRYSAAGGFESIGQIGTPPADGGIWGIFATGMSGDGNAIVGNTVGGRVGERASQPFIWRSGSGLATLPFLSSSPGPNPGSGMALPAVAFAAGISRDGSTVFGSSLDANSRFQAVIWRGGTITGLGFLPGATAADLANPFYGSQAYAANADGSIIVGTQDLALDPVTFESRYAWRWTVGTGMQDLNQIARDAGLSLGGYTLREVAGISDDGTIIAGRAGRLTENANGFFVNETIGFVFQLAQITRSQLIVQIRLPEATLTSIVNQSFTTEVAATLNGATVFTRSFADQIDTAAGAAALAEARAALQVSALRRITIGAPVLVSSTTTVAGTSSNTVDVLTATQVTTATVNAQGPTTVTTGDRGICATAAADNVDPTGCSLPGTPVSVPVGTLNANIYTNTLQSITPTTTRTVNQVVAARWQIAAVGGNQFGTVHALAGTAAFDRGDRLLAQLLGMGAGSDGADADGFARAAVPMRDASGLGGARGGLTMFGGYFRNGSRTDADPAVPVAEVRGDTSGLVLGVEQQFGNARIGLAVDHGSSDITVRDATYPETLDHRQTQLALFGGWDSGRFSLDGAAAYGFGRARTSLTTPGAPATARYNVNSWSAGVQAAYSVPLGASASARLVTGVRHTAVHLPDFTETGGPTPLQGVASTAERTRLFGGIELAAPIAMGSAVLTPRLHARAAHDSGDRSGIADLVFASAPNGPVLHAFGPGVGASVAELGGTLDLQVSGRVRIHAGYDGAFRSGSRSHTARAGLTMAF